MQTIRLGRAVGAIRILKGLRVINVELFRENI